MPDPDQFTTVLNQFVHRSAYTPGQLASLSTVPKMTIVNWLNGRVVRPRGWQGVVALAAAMRLTEAEANQLLAAAQQPTVQELRTLAAEAKDQALLGFWQTAIFSEFSPPFQAIALPPYLVGREEERALLRTLLMAEQQTAVTCLHGMAGVGKTSLAAQLAYDLHEHFADGVLWARLDSSDTLSILATFAAAYQQDVSQFYDVASRSRVVRDLLREKRTLIILDNAQTSNQIEPLLPSTGNCAVLVTTRRQDLSALAGASRVELRPFSPDATTSLSLFEQILGRARVQAEPDALRQIADALGHLPLALVIAASRLAYEPGWQIAQFQQRLAQVEQRLPALRYEVQNVRRSFQLSYELLDAPAQQLFAAVGLLGRQDFSVAAAAALVAGDADAVADGLRQLYTLSLLEGGTNGRYQLHPLLHDFAQSLTTPDGATEHFVAYWAAFVVENRLEYESVAGEIGHIEAALETAVREQWIQPWLNLLENLMPFWLVRGAYLQAEQCLAEAQTVLQSSGDDVGLSRVQLWWGQLLRQRQELAAAEEYLQAGLLLAQKQGDKKQIGRFLAEIGIVHNCHEQYASAKVYLAEALTLARQVDDVDCLLLLLEELGVLALMAGETAVAQQHQQEGFDLAQVHHHEAQAVLFRKSLGALSHLAQDREKARQQFAQGYALAQKIGFRKGMMLLSNNLGVVDFYAGNMVQAADYLQASLAEAERLNDFQAMSLVLQNLARLARQNGRFATARSYFNQLLALAKRREWPEMVAQVQHALLSLAELEEANGRNQAKTAQEHLRVFI